MAAERLLPLVLSEADVETSRLVARTTDAVADPWEPLLASVALTANEYEPDVPYLITTTNARTRVLQFGHDRVDPCSDATR